MQINISSLALGVFAGTATFIVLGILGPLADRADTGRSMSEIVSETGPPEPPPQTQTAEADPHAEILDAIWFLESSRATGRVPVGSYGEVGPLQITQAYLTDSRVQGTLEDCNGLDFSKLVVEEYMKRWVPEAWEAGDAQVVLRTHNGGPRGASKKATLKYWERGRTVLGL